MIFFAFAAAGFGAIRKTRSARNHPRPIGLLTAPTGVVSFVSCTFFELIMGLRGYLGQTEEKKTFMCAHRIHQFGVKVNLEEIDWNFLRS